MLTTALCVSQLPPFSWLSGFGLEAVSSAISRSFGNITFKLQVLTETHPIPLPRAVQQHGCFLLQSNRQWSGVRGGWWNFVWLLRCHQVKDKSDWLRDKCRQVWARSRWTKRSKHVKGLQSQRVSHPFEKLDWFKMLTFSTKHHAMEGWMMMRKWIRRQWNDFN